jgi:hypothetical protein
MTRTLTIALVLLAACGEDSRGDRPDGGRDIDADLMVRCGAAGSSGPGGRCDCGSECATGLVCGTEAVSQFPGGYCVQTCTPGASTGCPEGFECIGTSAASFCAPACTTVADCDRGRLCITVRGSEGACVPYCDENQECNSGHCDLISGLCTDGTPRPGAGLDERCTRHEDCQSNKCDQGRCATFCSVSDAHCPEGTACVPSIGTDLGECHYVCDPAGAPCALEGTACTTAPTGASVCTSADGCFGRPDVENTDGRPCGCTADCDAGSTCVPESTCPIPHGGCLRNCDADPGICGPGSSCSLIRAAGMDGCLTNCSRTADCGIGRVCGVGGTCEYVCQRDDDCVNRNCNLYTGRCEPEESGLPNGAICTASGECRSGLCFTLVSGGEKFCMSFCSVPEQVCPDGGVCVPFASAYDLGSCHPPCTTVDTCPAGTRCDDAGIPGMTVSACLDM